MVERSGRRPRLASGSSPLGDLDPKDFATAVGEAIRRVRQERGWTQAALAEAAGLSPNYVARLERGELGASLFVARQITDALGLDLDALVAPPARASRATARRQAR